MTPVQLQFDTPQKLSEFRNFAKQHVVKTDVLNLIIHCDCDQHFIDVAVKKYGAKLIMQTV